VAKSVVRPGAASSDLRVPGAASVATHRLPRRATRDGRRGARARASPSAPPTMRAGAAVTTGALWRSRR